MSANEHGPTNLQVYSKPAKLNCFCRQSCDLRLDNAAGGDRSLLENQHGISPSLHHFLEQRLACRVLPEKRCGSLTWTASGCPICIKYDFQQLRLQCLDPAAH